MPNEKDGRQKKGRKIFKNTTILIKFPFKKKLNHISMQQPPLILFDGICNLCCGWVQFLIKMDNKAKFQFSPLQSEAGQRMLSSFGLPIDAMETVIYIHENHYFNQSSAILKILNDLGGIWKVFIVFKLIPKPIRDAIYRFIAKNRYTVFGKHTSCWLPTPELQKRFLM